MMRDHCGDPCDVPGRGHGHGKIRKATSGDRNRDGYLSRLTEHVPVTLPAMWLKDRKACASCACCDR